MKHSYHSLTHVIDFVVVCIKLKISLDTNTSYTYMLNQVDVVTEEMNI